MPRNGINETAVATITAESIDGLERNWREEKLLIDEKKQSTD